MRPTPAAAGWDFLLDFTFSNAACSNLLICSKVNVKSKVHAKSATLGKSHAFGILLKATLCGS